MTKTFSFGALHVTVAFTVAYLMTGSVMVGGAIALVEPLVNTVAYFFHERIWERFGRRTAAA
jgi:uncharacterized membrane protein